MKLSRNNLLAIPMAILTAFSLFGAQTAKAEAPLLGQEYTVVYHNPDPEQYVEGPGLARFDDGSLLAVVPVVPRSAWSKERRMTRSVTHILRSEDGGQTWRRLPELPYYSAVPWIHEGKLYLFAFTPGTDFRNDDLLLLRSDDRGATWTEPVTLFRGHFWNCHTGMVFRGDKLYWAVDVLGQKAADRGPAAIVGDLSGDPMNPKAWQISTPVLMKEFPPDLVNAKFADLGTWWLEPNVIELNGRMRVLATVKPKRQTTAGLCAVFDILEEDGKVDLKFVQFHPMPGGQLKFTVLWDDVSQMFWSTANLVVDSQGSFDWWKEAFEEGNMKGISGGNDRRFLMLQYGLDGLNWFSAGCIARAGKVSQSFMYARPVIDGEDLALISRSSVAAPNQHDADYATFHRVRNFRSLALNLRPDAAP